MFRIFTQPLSDKCLDIYIRLLFCDLQQNNITNNYCFDIVFGYHYPFLYSLYFNWIQNFYFSHSMSFYPYFILFGTQFNCNKVSCIQFFFLWASVRLLFCFLSAENVSIRWVMKTVLNFDSSFKTCFKFCINDKLKAFISFSGSQTVYFNRRETDIK